MCIKPGEVNKTNNWLKGVKLRNLIVHAVKCHSEILQMSTRSLDDEQVVEIDAFTMPSRCLHEVFPSLWSASERYKEEI